MLMKQIVNNDVSEDSPICNSICCSDISHIYHERFFQNCKTNCGTILNITNGIYAKYHIQNMLLLVYSIVHGKKATNRSFLNKTK